MGNVVYVFHGSAGRFGFSGMMDRLDDLGYCPHPSKLSLWSDVMMCAPSGDGVDVAMTVLVFFRT